MDAMKYMMDIEKETETVAKLLVAEINKEVYVCGVEFVLAKFWNNKESEKQMIGLVGSGVGQRVRELIGEEKFYWMSARYTFVATKQQEEEGCVILGVGYMSKEMVKEKKKAEKLKGHKIATTCSYCLTVCDNLQKCGGCRFVSYCCKEHQTADWKHHKKECKKIADANNNKC